MKSKKKKVAILHGNVKKRERSFWQEETRRKEGKPGGFESEPRPKRKTRPVRTPKQFYWREQEWQPSCGKNVCAGGPRDGRATRAQHAESQIDESEQEQEGNKPRSETRQRRKLSLGNRRVRGR